jgi:hypothetical protein
LLVNRGALSLLKPWTATIQNSLVSRAFIFINNVWHSDEQWLALKKNENIINSLTQKRRSSSAWYQRHLEDVSLVTEKKRWLTAQQSVECRRFSFNSRIRLQCPYWRAPEISFCVAVWFKRHVRSYSWTHPRPFKLR